MDIYASDEEKAEAIKQWWRDNGRSVVAGIILGAAAILGFRYWQSHQQVQAEQASVLYQQTIGLLQQSQQDSAEDVTRQLMQDYASTPYAVFAALKMAESDLEADESTLAQEYLGWVVEHAELSSHRDLARLRLARIKLNETAFDEAMGLIQAEETQAYGSLFAELEGDVQLAQGDKAAAHSAYQRALMTMRPGESRQALLQMKVDNVAATHEG